MAKLYFRYGAMNSGKSTLLMQVAYNYEENNRKVLVIKSKIDTKGEDTLVSRIGLQRKVDILLDENESLMRYKKQIQNCNAILVDEVQFLKESQIDELWYIAHVFDIPVIGYGLKGDFKTNLFEGSKRMLELSDEITELVTICSCGKTARFNARKVHEKFTLTGEQNVIDGTKDITYVPLCADCYIKKKKKKTKQSF